MGYRNQKDYNYDYTDVKDTSILQVDYFLPSTLENIDASLLDKVKSFEIQTTTNKGFTPVPVIWTSAERSFQVKNNPELRDDDDSIILPIMTVERTSFEKSLSRKGGIFGNQIPTVGYNGDVQGGSITIARRINQDKTSNFANATAKRRFSQENYKFQNDKVVYETITVPLPIYVDINYIVRLRSQYQQQMNDMVAPFVNLGYGVNYFTLARNGHKYEGFVQADMATENNLASMGTEERIYQTNVSIKVLGYIIGNDKNQERPKVVKRENAVEVYIGRERSIVGDIPDHRYGSENYRR
jgi:hypothetical protein